MHTISDPGLPEFQSPGQLARSLASVAQATIDARHPGPHRDPTDPLEQILSSSSKVPPALGPSFTRPIPSGPPSPRGYYTTAPDQRDPTSQGMIPNDPLVVS